ncbi:ammonium transporter, partial [Aduncisulcus paluster]
MSATVDSGNTGFMLISTALVMIMTPGLAFFYGGLVGRKSVVTIMMQSFVSLAVTTVVWFLYGYSLCFSEGAGSIFGNFKKALFLNIDMDSLYTSSEMPEYVFLVYQMCFAVITPALITGAFTNRVRFAPYLIFLVLWLTCVYFPAVHSIWGGGFLQEWGVLDFAGGIVVHATAGMAALASVFYVGKRHVVDQPHSIPLIAIG